MNLNEYQVHAMRTDPELVPREALLYGGLAIGGEAGEVEEYIKKVIFHGHEFKKEKLKEELGDVLWYISYLAHVQGMTLEEVARANIEKLLQRYPNGFSSKDSIERRDVELVNIT